MNVQKKIYIFFIIALKHLYSIQNLVVLLFYFKKIINETQDERYKLAILASNNF